MHREVRMRKTFFLIVITFLWFTSAWGYPAVSQEIYKPQLCKSLRDGALLESEEQFQQILKAYKELGFTSEEGGDPYMRFHLKESEREYDVVSDKIGENFHIIFSAYYQTKGPLSAIKIGRYEYLITPQGNVTLMKEINFINGPSLSIQTASYSFDGEGPFSPKKPAQCEQLGEEIKWILPHDLKAQLEILCPKKAY
jgi:hypothetical protein